MADPIMACVYYFLKWGTRNNPANADCPNEIAEADIEAAAPVAPAPVATRADSSVVTRLHTPFARPHDVRHVTSRSERTGR